VRVKLKRTDFRVLTRQLTLAEPTDVAADLFAAAISLLDDFRDAGPFRLVGLAAFDLRPTAAERQLDLDVDRASRTRRLETTLDRVADRFGGGAVLRASDLLRDRGVGVPVNLDFLADDADAEAPAKPARPAETDYD
jgi:DNA polymerase-4